MAWRRMVAAGVYLPENPYSSFFYLLTGVHGVHVVAGLAWLLSAALRLRKARKGTPGPGIRSMADAAAVFWHAMGGLWVALFALFLLA